ncbi:MAG TPA: MOFRL family protein, partial [Gemmatimonadales bacterium]
TPVAGEASAAGAKLAATLLHHCARHTVPQPETLVPPICVIWGGETTVSLGEGTSGVGGRCQELALAAARTLSGWRSPVALLAAGTDGRDGPTDAAGAIVDNHTWRLMEEAGRDPARDLATHNAYPALESAGALLRTGLTETNVMDVVIGVCVG